MVRPQPGLGATGCGDARSSGAHPPLRTAAACTRSEHRSTPRPRKPARPPALADVIIVASSDGSGGRRAVARQATAPRLAAWPRPRITHPAVRPKAQGRPPRAMANLLRARFSRFAKLRNLSFAVARSGVAQPAQPRPTRRARGRTDGRGGRIRIRGEVRRRRRRGGGLAPEGSSCATARSGLTAPCSSTTTGGAPSWTRPQPRPNPNLDPTPT